jgi:Zn-dependent peptidase ImmA (M78 family)
MSAKTRESRLAAADAAVNCLFESLPPDVRRLLERVPRDVEAILGSVFPARVEYVADLTMDRVHEILTRRHGAGLDPHETERARKVGGFVWAAENRAVVFVETRYGEAYARFTLAHELAHLWLEFIGQVLRTGLRTEPWTIRDDRSLHAPGDAEGDPSARESAANAFAASLLMPARPVLELADAAVESGTNLWDALGDMRSRFGVSDWALALRLYELGRISWKEYERVRAAAVAEPPEPDVP